MFSFQQATKITELQRKDTPFKGKSLLAETTPE
jgi:hypothetical protein